MSKNNISFILNKPQLSENIGACARAIKNFNFKKLILINPKPIFPNDKILATSVGAKDIINKSKVFKSIEKSILFKSDIEICFMFLFLNLADVATKMSIFLIDSSISENTSAFLIISLALTEVAKILSLGKDGLGLINNNLLKLKFLIALAQAPIFSDNCGLCKIKEIFLKDIRC